MKTIKGSNGTTIYAKNFKHGIVSVINGRCMNKKTEYFHRYHHKRTLYEKESRNFPLLASPADDIRTIKIE